jgi:hypothetical protein
MSPVELRLWMKDVVVPVTEKVDGMNVQNAGQSKKTGQCAKKDVHRRDNTPEG